MHDHTGGTMHSPAKKEVASKFNMDVNDAGFKKVL